jgi:hypothetical protein
MARLSKTIQSQAMRGEPLVRLTKLPPKLAAQGDHMGRLALEQGVMARTNT